MEEMVTVQIIASTQVSYEKKVEMTRSEYEALNALSDFDLAEEIISEGYIDPDKPSDVSDDLIIDGFEIA